MFAQQVPPERDALKPFANGKVVEFVKWALGVVVMVLVAYYTSLGTINERVTAVETREQAHFEEVMRSLERIEKQVTALQERGR